MGPILDTIAVSHVVDGTIHEESGKHVSVYNTLYCILQGSVASPPRLPYTPLCPLAQLAIALPSSSSHLKKEREREKKVQMK
jgi:hypothetical protein